jgi:hypothetical protein
MMRTPWPACLSCRISGEIAMAVAGDVTGPADGKGSDQPAGADAKR